MKPALPREHKSSESMKAAAIVMIAAVLLFLLVSTFFIAYEADHECTGEDCPVCALIQIVENNLRQLGSGAPVAAAVSSLILLSLVLQIRPEYSITISTPVSRKTRLNN